MHLKILISERATVEITVPTTEFLDKHKKYGGINSFSFFPVADLGGWGHVTLKTKLMIYTLT